jgi:glycosyltransferase involved in cell wall biosynthesis
MRLGIVASHPVQYQVPWYRALAAREDVDLTVYYALLPTPEQQGVGFGERFAWDVQLLDGYRWQALPNTARAPSLDGFLASRTPAVTEVLEADRPDAVIVSGWNALPLLQAVWAGGRLGIPLLVRGDSNALRSRPPWTRAVHRWLLSRFAACLAVGEANRHFYRRNGVPEARIFMVPYAIDEDRFRRQAKYWAPRRDGIRRGWGIASDDACILFAGKLVPKKRVLDLLRACELASEAGAAVKPLLVGTGKMADEAERFARDRGLEAVFTGFLNQSEISRAYVAADCLVLPSDYGETWGLVVNEAMVHELPVVVSDRVGCGPDLVREGVTGHVFPFADTVALGDILVRLARDPEARRRMGREAARHIRGFSLAQAVEGTVRALEFVTGRRAEATT